MTIKIDYFRPLSHALALVYVLSPSTSYAVMHSMSNNNFTMIDPTGAVIGGATDVSGSFDDTKICNSNACTDFGMTLASSQPFFGNLWTAHDIRIFSEGSYVFDTKCTGADIAAGITDCSGSSFVALTVGPGQLGAHILFDWGGEQ